jgi:hypothetical protein
MPFVAELAVDVSFAAVCFFLAGLLWAVIYLIRALHNGLAHISIPVVGGWIVGAFDAIANPVESWLIGAAGELASDAQWWVRGISWLANWLVGDIVSALHTDAAFIAHLFNTVIPSTITHVTSTVTTYADTGAATLAKGIADAERTLTHDISGAAAKAWSDLAAAEKSLTHDITSDIAREWSNAERLVSKTKTTVLSAVGKAVTSAETYTDHQIGTLRKDLTDAIGAIHVPSLAGVEADVAAVGVSVAGVAALAEATAAEFESCAVTTCEGPNNLQSLLSNLLGFASVAEIAVFLEQAISDPVGTANSASTDFQRLAAPFIGGSVDVWSALESVLGI